MIKGVTKSIIEISPRSGCFEKVIVILNSSCSEPEKAEIQRQAELMTGAVPDFLKRQRSIYFLKMTFSAVIGALITAGIFVSLNLFV